MANVMVKDIRRATALLGKLVVKSDLNKDGAIRDGDVQRIRNQALVGPVTRASAPNETQMLCMALDTFRRSAAGQGGPTTDNIRALLGQTKEKLAARDVDGDGVISDLEGKRSLSASERALLLFADACKGLAVSDFKLPAASEAHRPRFSWTGTPEKVCQSLLDAFSNPANDNKWPSWGTLDGAPRASRYVVNTTEATAMVEALRPLYTARQKAVLTELASRTHSSTYGCVSPDAGGKRVLKAFAHELGLTLRFDQPAAPRMPAP